MKCLNQTLRPDRPWVQLILLMRFSFFGGDLLSTKRRCWLDILFPFFFFRPLGI